MNAKFLLFTVFFVTGILIISGCIGEKAVEPEPYVPESENQKELSLDEIIEKTNSAIGRVGTYETGTKNKITIDDTLQEEDIKSKFDRKNKKKYKLNSYLEIAAGEEIPIKTETYILDDTAYINVAKAAWIKHETGWHAEDTLSIIKELLNNASSYEEGRYEGINVYVLQINPDTSIFYENFMAIGGADGTDVESMINNSENLKVTVWISKDKFLPLKQYAAVNTKLNDDFVEIEIETIFKDYNAPQNIQLPEDAESAEDVMADVKIENPEQVTKTINAIENITSYDLNIKKRVTGLAGGDETCEIRCDRLNKKMVNVNTYDVKVDEAVYESSITTYTINNLNYLYDDFSEGWFKHDTEWSDEDFLELIKNLLIKTKVEVTEGDETWIFEVKVNKEVFSGDFTELAIPAKNPEVTLNELNANSKNAAVKIWVSKETFLPVKEVMSIESRYEGMKMTINKEFNFMNYDEPITITLPTDARGAERID